MKKNQISEINLLSKVYLAMLILFFKVAANPNNFEKMTFRIADDNGAFKNSKICLIDNLNLVSNNIMHGEFKLLVDSLNANRKIATIKNIEIIERDYDEYVLLDSANITELSNEIKMCNDKDSVNVCCLRKGIKCSLKGRSDLLINQIQSLAKNKQVLFTSADNKIFAFILHKASRNCIVHYFIKKVTINDLRNINSVKDAYYMGYSTINGFCDIFQYYNVPEIIGDINQMSEDEKKAINELKLKNEAPNKRST